MPRVTTLLESWLLFLSDPFWSPEELWCGEGESARHSSSSQTRSVVPFSGRLVRWAWLRGSFPSSLTAGTRVSSGHLVRGSPCWNDRTGRGKHSLLGFAAWDARPVDAGEGACASERVLRQSEREAGERFWRAAGESLERGLERGWRGFLERVWREPGERELMRMYHLL